MSAPGSSSTSVLLATLTEPAPGGGEIAGELRDYGDDVTASARAGLYELERDAAALGERWYWGGGEYSAAGVPQALREAMRGIVDALIGAHRR